MNHDDDANLVIDIEAMLGEAETSVTDDCCIYRVPFGIRRCNQDAYTPKVVSIGPFHHDSHSRLQSMEQHKLSYCKAFLQRSETASETWTRYIKGVEPNIRRCYSDTLEFTQAKLVKILFVDSGFILELFLRYHSRQWSKDDACLSKPWLDTIIRLDLLLLENQLPFSLLQSLYNMSVSSRSKDSFPSFVELTFDYFDYYNGSNLECDNISISHFTDLIRTFHLQHPPQKRPPRTDDDLVMHLPSATELSEAGVRIRVNSNSECLLDLNFSRGVLKIPKLTVEDGTELIFRNMVALEQCHYPDESYIIDYVDFLDFLVNTSRDVDLLVQKGVLVNWLGDTDSLANMFNGLMKSITQTNGSSHYFQLSQRLNAFCKDPLHKLNSTLRRDYCNSPWKTVVSIAGIFLLILSLVQSVCSVLQVIQQHNASPKTW
ncbi:hypothetical protein Fmac_000735 [Flemingia macrophylla]|uniref:Uncharacterized protein n=1 Tax=Flemingia macrophylla TaxID=520843 RepID=A0ABD1NF38_9FABA